MSTDISELKKGVRRAALARRRALTPAERGGKSRRIAELLCECPAVVAARTVMCYLPMPDEVDITGVIDHALALDKRVCVPHITDRDGQMEAVFLRGRDELTTGDFGILTARATVENMASPADIDLIIVPGCAFDAGGRRLGMGRGFYDRFMPKAVRAATVGVAFACQLVERVPCERHDFSVDYIVTEEGIISSITGKM